MNIDSNIHIAISENVDKTIKQFVEDIRQNSIDLKIIGIRNTSAEDILHVIENCWIKRNREKRRKIMQIGKEMAIPSILKIGNGALGKIGGYLKAENLDQVVLFFGNGLIDMFGELVMNSLKEADVKVLEYNELDTVDIDDIITLAFAIPNKAKAVISIGGGK